eukprot:jgi/Orpsp1_1/1192867/evm.model.d7180000096420.1
MSDWWAIFDVEKSFGAGTDMNMPGGKYWGPDYVGDSFWGEHILESIEKGVFPKERLDDAVLRIIRTLYKAEQMEDYPEVDLYVDTNTEENAALNRKVGADSNVLLKNADDILPIKKVKKIAVIGKDSMPPTLCEDMKCANGTLPLGWGSGTTDFKYVIDPLSAITKRAKKDNISVVSYGEDDGENAAKVAKDADIAIVFVQADSGEEYITVEGNAGDRLNLDLWHGGNELIDAVASVNKNTIVVIHSPGPVNVPFLDKVKGIVFAGLPGQETGNAITDVLFGDVNPSGHLPYTWAPREDYPTDVKYEPEYPDGGEKMTVYDYDEGLFVGYRWFDKKEIEPTFAFGYGLSYTTFEYSDLKVEMKEDGLYVTLTMEYVRPKEGEFTVYAGSNAKDLPLKTVVSASVEENSEEEEENSDADTEITDNVDDIEEDSNEEEASETAEVEESEEEEKKSFEKEIVTKKTTRTIKKCIVKTRKN